MNFEAVSFTHLIGASVGMPLPEHLPIKRKTPAARGTALGPSEFGIAVTL